MKIIFHLEDDTKFLDDMRIEFANYFEKSKPSQCKHHKFPNYTKGNSKCLYSSSHDIYLIQSDNVQQAEQLLEIDEASDNITQFIVDFQVWDDTDRSKKPNKTAGRDFIKNNAIHTSGKSIAYCSLERLETWDALKQDNSDPNVLYNIVKSDFNVNKKLYHQQLHHVFETQKMSSAEMLFHNMYLGLSPFLNEVFENDAKFKKVVEIGSKIFLSSDSEELVELLEQLRKKCLDPILKTTALKLDPSKYEKIQYPAPYFMKDIMFEKKIMGAKAPYKVSMPKRDKNGYFIKDENGDTLMNVDFANASQRANFVLQSRQWLTNCSHSEDTPQQRDFMISTTDKNTALIMFHSTMYTISIAKDYYNEKK